MRAYARKLGEDEVLWGVAGLVHDFDYEEHPDMDAPTAIRSGALSGCAARGPIHAS